MIYKNREKILEERIYETKEGNRLPLLTLFHAGAYSGDPPLFYHAGRRRQRRDISQPEPEFYQRGRPGGSAGKLPPGGVGDGNGYRAGGNQRSDPHHKYSPGARGGCRKRRSPPEGLPGCGRTDNRDAGASSGSLLRGLRSFVYGGSPAESYRALSFRDGGEPRSEWAKKE